MIDSSMKHNLDDAKQDNAVNDIKDGDSCVFKTHFANPTVVGGKMLMVRLTGRVCDEMLENFFVFEEEYEKHIRRKLIEDSLEEVVFYFSSYGGQLIVASNIIDFVDTWNSSNKTKISFLGSGEVASAAVNIMISGYRRYSYGSTRYLIHSLRAGIWDRYNYLVDNMSEITRMQTSVEEYISTKTKLTIDQVKELMKSDSFFGVDKAVEYGIVDDVWRY